MDPLAWHEMVFKQKCSELMGNAFQDFFSDIMKRYDQNFIQIRPSGPEGDHKCDGYSTGSNTVYQCYAPESWGDGRRAVKKIREDFEGARAKWGGSMKQWVFVYNAPKGLPPLVVQQLQSLQASSLNCMVFYWGTPRLWGIIQDLTEQDRNVLLGNPPGARTATEVTTAEVETLLNYLAEQPAEPVLDNLELIDIGDKIDRNRLGHWVRKLIRESLPVAKLAEDYLKRHPDLQYSAKVGSVLMALYDSMQQNYADTDEVFAQLLSRVSNQRCQPKFLYAAAGIIVHYFQLCEVFET